MKNITATFVCLWFILFSSNANAWFFFFLPGSVTSKIGDVQYLPAPRVTTALGRTPRSVIRFTPMARL